MYHQPGDSPGNLQPDTLVLSGVPGTSRLYRQARVLGWQWDHRAQAGMENYDAAEQPGGNLSSSLALTQQVSSGHNGTDIQMSNSQ